MPVTRRQLLVGATSLAAVSALGCSRDPDLDAESFDVCVIGSGFAGTLLARRTVANGLKTVMIEAGSHPRKPGNNQIAAAFTTANSGVVSFPVDGTRRIALGGTSNLWAGVVTRLWPNDFRMQSEYGRMVDWPISYGELEPYYCEAERLLGVEGDPFVEGGEPPRKCAYPIERPEPYEQTRVPDRG